MRSDPGTALAVACPKCKAKAGRPCRDTLTGFAFVMVHRERVAAAQEVPDEVPADQVAKWRRAVAEHQARLRRQRTIRPAPEPTAGYRKVDPE